MKKIDQGEDLEGAILNRDGVREGLLACKEDLKVTEGANRGMGYGGLFKEAGTANAKAWRQPHFFPRRILGGNEGREAGPAASSIQTGALLPEEPVLGFMIYSCGLEIPNYF